MELRQIEKNDYDLILELDAKVYPVSKENKINPETIERWYNKYPKYGMIYSYQNKIVALSIAIPMPMSVWYKLIKWECFENTLNIQWEKSENENNDNESSSFHIGIHIYHIEVLDRGIVGKGFYKHMLQDLNKISQNYNHQIDGFSGYCVTPKGNRLFQEILKCKNADDINGNNNNIINEKKDMSEFIVQNPSNGNIKILECPCNTDITKPYLADNTQSPQEYKFISKCNMLYTIREDSNTSPVWEYFNNN